MLGSLIDMFKMLKITETSFKKTNVQMWQKISQKDSLNFGKVLTNYYYYIISEVLRLFGILVCPPCSPMRSHQVTYDSQ
jgi:hypothetical protein